MVGPSASKWAAPLNLTPCNKAYSLFVYNTYRDFYNLLLYADCEGGDKNCRAILMAADQKNLYSLSEPGPEVSQFVFLQARGSQIGRG